LSNHVDRGLDVEQGVLVIIDGSKALRAAINDVLGRRTPVQRSTAFKERNVFDHLPERHRGLIKRRLRRALAAPKHDLALEQLRTLAGELDRSHPDAAASRAKASTRR
jgi:putative transposase